MFARLRDRWLEAEPKRTKTQLAKLLGVSLAHMSNWTSSGSSPPWWAILRLCWWVGAEIRITPDKMTLERRREL